MKKKNPRRRPATEADVKRAKAAAQEEAISLAMAIMFTAMLDGGFLTPEQMKPAWEKVNYLSDSIAKRYVNVHDLVKVLEEEYDIILGEGKR